MPVGATGAWCAQSAAGCQVLTYAQKPAWPVQSVWLDSVPPGYTCGIAQVNAPYSNSPFGCPANCAGCAPTPVFPGQGGGSGGGQGTPYEPPYQEPATPPPPAPPPQLPYVPSQGAPVDVPPPLLGVPTSFGQRLSAETRQNPQAGHTEPFARPVALGTKTLSARDSTRPETLFSSDNALPRLDTLATIRIEPIGAVLGCNPAGGELRPILLAGGPCVEHPRSKKFCEDMLHLEDGIYECIADALAGR